MERRSLGLGWLWLHGSKHILYCYRDNRGIGARDPDSRSRGQHSTWTNSTFSMLAFNHALKLLQGALVANITYTTQPGQVNVDDR